MIRRLQKALEEEKAKKIVVSELRTPETLGGNGLGSEVDHGKDAGKESAPDKEDGAVTTAGGPQVEETKKPKSVKSGG